MTLTCEVAKEGANITFMKDGKEIKPSDKHEIIIEGTKATLIIHDATPDDQGEYTAKTEDDTTSCKLLVEGEKCGC